MGKIDRLTSEQAIKIGYTKPERVITVAFSAMLCTIIISVLSLILLQPLIEILVPESGKGFMPESFMITLFAFLINSVLGIICAITIYVCVLILGSKLKSENSHRLRPLVINNFIACPAIAVALISTFIDYGWFRAIVAAIAIVALTVSTITSYCIYYKRYRQDIMTFTDSDGQPTNGII